MTMGATGSGSNLYEVIESARRLGVELDEDEAVRWVAALESESLGGDLVVDVDSGVFGHRVSMLDFSTRDIARFRAIGEVVGFPDRPPVVRTALALSGSAAQSKVNTFPGDCDFFERVNIAAPTRADACAILGDEMRAKALATRLGPTFRLWEVKLGTWPFDATRPGGSVRAGSPVSWSPAEVEAGRIDASRDGEAVAIAWDEAAAEPGWCKLDWIVADPARRALANASNVLDVTWEAPDGAITSLDGAIDPYFCEVYLETESLPLVRRLVHELSSDSDLLAHAGAEGRTRDVAAIKDQALRAVNEYFERRLAEVPSIRAYVDELVASAHA
jgi:hypothetical protein